MIIIYDGMYNTYSQICKEMGITPPSPYSDDPKEWDIGVKLNIGEAIEIIDGKIVWSGRLPNTEEQPLSTKTVESTLANRGQRYGSFELNVQTVAHIVSAMAESYRDNRGGNEPSSTLLVEWHYLAIKLARISADPEYGDSYHDLAGYATLLEQAHVGE